MVDERNGRALFVLTVVTVLALRSTSSRACSA
jgi:hypothetical protein